MIFIYLHLWFYIFTYDCILIFIQWKIFIGNINWPWHLPLLKTAYKIVIRYFPISDTSQQESVCLCTIFNEKWNMTSVVSLIGKHSSMWINDNNRKHYYFFCKNVYKYDDWAYRPLMWFQYSKICPLHDTQNHVSII